MYKLSISIVVYNNYLEVVDAIKSIEKFTNFSLSKHIYIIDNSDFKSNLEEFKKFLSQYDDIEYICLNKNIGFGRVHNLVLDKINSEYHAIVNPDILLVEDSFSKILSWMDENHDVGMAVPDLRYENGNRQLSYREELTVFDMFSRFFFNGRLFKKRFYKHTLQYKNYNEPFDVPFAQGSFLVIRTSLFKELHGFDDNFFLYCEDADLCKRLNKISKLMYYPYTKVIHKWHRSSKKSFKNFRYHIISARYYFKKWGYKWL